jgi:hypothetical protein
MVSIILVVLGAFIPMGFVFADFDPGTWTHLKTIIVPPGVADEYVRVPVDQDVAFGARADLSDLRVVEGSAFEVPYQYIVETEAMRNEQRSGVIRDLSTANGETMFIIDLGSRGSIHDHLSIVTPSKNFKRTVRVYAADSLVPHSSGDWRLLTDKGYIYNFYDQVSGFNAGSGEVAYPESASQYLRVVISSGEGSEVVVSSAYVRQFSARELRMRTITTAAAVVENTEFKTTEITVDLGGAGIPTHRITLSTGESENFSRRAAIMGSNDLGAWTSLGEGYVFSLDTPLFNGRQLAISYRDSQYRYIRIIVRNDDDRPVSWNNAVTIDSVVRSVVFRAVSGKNYSLYYGNQNARQPKYDLARFFQYIESSALREATLGEAKANLALAKPEPKPVPYTATRPMILNSILVLLVAVVSFLLIAYLKKLKMTKHGD